MNEENISRKDYYSLVAEVAASKTVASMFAMFCNEKSRGVNFTWDKFPDMMKKFISGSVFMYVADDPEVFETAKRVAEDTAYHLAKDMVESAGFLSNNEGDK